MWCYRRKCFTERKEASIALNVVKATSQRKAEIGPLEFTGRGYFSGGPVVKNPPFSAANTGSIPGWETEIPYDTGQLSTTTTEPT